MNINIIPKFIDNALGPPAQAIGDTLSELWDLGIGSHVSLWGEKQTLRQQNNFTKYKASIEEKTQSIPNDKLTDPQLHIVGPAIEASKYYIESDELREMFANLIAASIDSRKIDRTHPSFVEIIKQMSPLDAQNLALFKDVVQFPICQYRLINDSRHYKTLLTNIFLENKEVTKLDLIASSLENLSRLGLIFITYESYIPSEKAYEQFKNNIYYEIQENLRSGYYPTYEDVDIKKGISKSTPLGKDFIDICMP